MSTDLSTKPTETLPKISPVRRWSSLWHGDGVEMRSLGTHLHYATVDEVTDDGQIIWLVPDGGSSPSTSAATTSRCIALTD